MIGLEPMSLVLKTNIIKPLYDTNNLQMRGLEPLKLRF
jgi:hypothetical protein